MCSFHIPQLQGTASVLAVPLLSMTPLYAVTPQTLQQVRWLPFAAAAAATAVVAAAAVAAVA
jgi:hypothetical protein